MVRLNIEPPLVTIRRLWCDCISCRGTSESDKRKIELPGWFDLLSSPEGFESNKYEKNIFFNSVSLLKQHNSTMCRNKFSLISNPQDFIGEKKTFHLDEFL